MDKPVLKTSTDTGLLKIIAFLSMLIDHIGFVFLPQYEFLRVIGRIAFPLFAYTLVLGFIHTRNIKKYFIRLLGFAALSQIPYWLCFYSYAGVIERLNIGFTMMLGLYACWGIREKKYLHTALALLLSLIPAVEYGFYGVILITAMYIFIGEGPALFGITFAIINLCRIVTYFSTGWFDLQIWAILALPFMLLPTRSGIKIPRLLNYGFYPAHLLLIWAAAKFLI